MNEVDIFIELLDGKELNNISRIMKIPVRSKSHRQVYEIKLKQKFKSGEKSFKKFITMLKDEKLSVLTQNEYLIFLRYFPVESFSNHKKYINFLNYFPEKAKEMLPKIEENLRQEKHIFDFNILFEETDVISFLNKVFDIFDKELIIDAIDITVNFIMGKKLVKFKEVEFDKVKNYELECLLKSLQNASIEEELLSKYFYIKTHRVDEPLYSQFLLYIFFHLLVFFKPHFSKIKKAEEYTGLIEENKKLKKRNKKLINKYTNIKKDLERNIKENKELKETVNEKQNQMKIYESKLMDSQNDYSNLVEKHNNVEKNVKKYKKEIKKLSLYLDNFTNTLDNTKKIAVISTFNRYVVKRLYGKEVIFLSNQEIEKNKMLNIPDTVKYVLIERYGVNSITIRKLKRQFKEKNIIVKIINPNDEKELLEELIKMKQKIKEVS